MSNIGKSTFLNKLKYGVDLKKLEIGEDLTNKGVDKKDIEKLDTNKDGVLNGAELKSLFKHVDSFDLNGSGRSFATDQTGGVLYGALKKATQEGPYHGVAISKAAKARAEADPSGYAYSNAPTSPLKELSGNKKPGTTRPRWLQNNNKCNQFVGDALTQAGMEMPTFTMTDGSKHYVNAERLPNYKKHFDLITDPKKLKEGDVVVKDYPATGESTAHTEVVTKSDPANDTIKTTGAHGSGAYEKDWSDLLDGAKYDPAKQGWKTSDGDMVYLLRPIKKSN